MAEVESPEQRTLVAGKALIAAALGKPAEEVIGIMAAHAARAMVLLEDRDAELRELRAAVKTARAEAFREAAKVCEPYLSYDEAVQWCIDEIRDLATNGGTGDGE